MIDATDIAGRVRSGGVSAEQIVSAALDRCRADQFNAMTAVFAHRAIERARRVDDEVAAGRDPGVLAGVPFAVKNLVDVEGVVTLAGSSIRSDDAPASVDASCVALLEAAGGVLVGTTNMDEFAYGFTTENSHFGATKNPLDPTRIAGGSSGGSAAAVAGGLVPLAIGSDTNGSIRVPAALCGITGWRPTMKRINLAGVAMFVRSLDTVGPLTRNVRDLRLAASVLDPSIGVGAADGRELRIAVLGGYFSVGGDDIAHQAVRIAAASLDVSVEVELPGASVARSAAMVMTAAEGAEEHYCDLRDRADEFDPMTRDRFLAGTHVSAVQYLASTRVQRAFFDETAKVFSDVDVVIAPATPCLATPIGERRGSIGGVDQLIAPNLGMFTQPISFAHLPVVTVPVDVGAEFPAAVQIVAGRGADEDAFEVADRLMRRLTPDAESDGHR